MLLTRPMPDTKRNKTARQRFKQTMRKSRSSAIAIATAVLVAAAAGYFVVDQIHRDRARAAAASAAPAGVPVTAEIARLQDMPIYVRGIGTVQAYRSVTIKTRVDG